MLPRKLRTLALTAALAGAAIAAAPAAADAASFETPSGNIACHYSSYSAQMRCDVRSDDLGVTMSAFGAPHWHYSMGIEGGRVLHYGQHWRSKHFTCVSRVSGLRCVERHTGRGFVLARNGESYRF